MFSIYKSACKSPWNCFILSLEASNFPFIPKCINSVYILNFSVAVRA